MQVKKHPQKLWNNHIFSGFKDHGVAGRFERTCAEMIIIFLVAHPDRMTVIRLYEYFYIVEGTLGEGSTTSCRSYGEY